MNREFLTPFGLGKEDVEKIMAEHGKATAAIKDKVTTQFTTQLTEAQAEVTNLNGVIATRDKDIEDLKKSNKTVDDLNTQLSDLQSKYATEKTEREADKAEAEKKLIQAKTDSAIELALTNAKAKNIKTVLPLLDADGLVLDGEVLKGMDKQLETIKMENPFLFDVEEAKPETPPATPQITVGGNPQTPPPGGEKSWRDRMNENVAKAKKQE